MPPTRILIITDSQRALEQASALLRGDVGLQLVGEAQLGAGPAVLARCRASLIVLVAHLEASLVATLAEIEEIMVASAMPIVVLSLPSADPRRAADEASLLKAGAVAVFRLPGELQMSGDDRSTLLAGIKAMAEMKVVRHWRRRNLEPNPRRALNPAPGPGEAAALGGGLKPWSVPCRLIAVAASTGGPAALQEVFGSLPKHYPRPILVVQHIARGFTAGLVTWLGSVCALKVKIAEEDEALAPGTVYLAPDDHHLGVSLRHTIHLSTVAAVGGFRPSADVLFTSVAKAYGPGLVALILTGMGNDGTNGLAAVRAAGGRILAQDEASSVVFGMPAAAIEAGLADLVAPLSALKHHLLNLA